jgi:hypothetical protein
MGQAAEPQSAQGAPGQSFAFDNGDALAEIPRMSVFFVLFLNIVTFSLYGPIWFLRRAERFNRLQAPWELHQGILATALMGRIVILGLSAYVGFLAGAGWDTETVQVALLEGFSGFLGLLVFVLYFHQCLRLRAMLKSHIRALTGREFPNGWFWVFLFQELNLQYAVNRAKDRLG